MKMDKRRFMSLINCKRCCGYFLINWTKDSNNPVLTLADLNGGEWPAGAYDPDQGALGQWFVLVQAHACPNCSIDLFTGNSANDLTKHPASPVIIKADDWEKVHREPHSLWWDDNTKEWRLYYCARGTDRPEDYCIGLATSTDFIHWKRYDKNPIFCNGKLGVADPHVVKYNDKFYMSAALYGSFPYNGHWFVSDDGITEWEEISSMRGLGPFGEAALDEGITGLSYWMYAGGSPGIHAGFTPNGKQYYSYSKNPVIKPVIGTWEDHHQTMSTLVATKDGTKKNNGKYYFYYFAENPDNKRQMGLAVTDTLLRECRLSCSYKLSNLTNNLQAHLIARKIVFKKIIRKTFITKRKARKNFEGQM